MTNSVYITKGAEDSLFLKINYHTLNDKVIYRDYEWVTVQSLATPIPNLDALAIKGELERKGNIVRIF